MRTRIRSGAAAVATASALLLVAACGSDSSSDGDKKPTGTASEAKDTAGEETSGDATALTAAQMKAATVELKDLPPVWKEKAVEVDAEPTPTSDKPECQPVADLMDQTVKGATMSPSVEFQGKEDEGGISHTVFTFAGTGAADFTKKLGTALDSCTKASFTMSGQTIAVDVKKLSTAKVGEESHALQISTTMAELGSVKMTIDMMVARQGAGLSRATYTTLAKPDTPAGTGFDDIAKRIGDKFVKGAQS